MAVEIVAQGGPGSLGALGAYEQLFAEGERGTILIRFRSLPPGLAGWLQSLIAVEPQLRGRATASVAGPDTVALRFKKGLPILAPLAIMATTAITGAVGWSITKESSKVVNYLGLGLIAFVAIKALMGRKRQADAR